MIEKGWLADFWAWLHTDAGTMAVAGAAGGVVRWMTLRERPGDGLSSLVVGALCAIYLGPLALPMLQPVVGAISPGQDAGGFASFVVGLGGIGVSGFVIETLRAFRKARQGRGDAE